jgi:Bifunctional DNA primase/polymerase, N-terminal
MIARFAAAYASKGWHVLPIEPGGKQPAHDLVTRGVRDATLDPRAHAEWWYEGSPYGLAVAAGPSGLAILDVDTRNGGHTSLDALTRLHGGLPRTPCVETGGGGWHFYFEAPELYEDGRLVRLRSGKLGHPGLDLKSGGAEDGGAGGYVVAPPSVHPSGLAYRWAESARPSVTALAPLPPWLVELARVREVVPPPPAPRRERVRGSALDRCRAYVARIDPAVSGQNGHTRTFDVARRCVQDFGLSEDEAWVVLCEYNQRCAPPWSERELRHKLKSAGRARVGNTK